MFGMRFTEIFSHPGKVPQVCLQWSTRSQQLAKQLKQYNPDIMCLEEVEEGHFKDFLIPLFPGYHGSHAPKKLSPCMKVAENHGPDGVAIFFRTSRFTLKESGQRYLTEENGEEGMNEQFLFGFSCVQCIDNIRLSGKKFGAWITHH